MNKELLQEMISSLLNGGEFKYEDENIKINMNSNGIFITSQQNKDKEVKLFLDFCEQMDDDLFVKVCETFTPEALAKLESDLDTDNYKNTIIVFTNAVRTIAKFELEKLISEADVEIRKHEQTIAEAQKAINRIHAHLDEAHKKYATYVRQ